MRTDHPRIGSAKLTFGVLTLEVLDGAKSMTGGHGMPCPYIYSLFRSQAFNNTLVIEVSGIAKTAPPQKVTPEKYEKPALQKLLKLLF